MQDITAIGKRTEVRKRRAKDQRESARFLRRLTQFHLRSGIGLKDGETFDYSPPANHLVAWVFSQSGALKVSGEVLTREMAVFEESNGSLHFQADGDTAFLLGTAVKRLAPLMLGPYSVHTSPSALKAGTSRINEIGVSLRNADRSSMS